MPIETNLQTANQARVIWTILVVLVLLCSIEQLLALAQIEAHVFWIHSQSKAYVVAMASHYLLLLYLFQAAVTLQHVNLAQVPPFPLGTTEAVRFVTGFRFFTDRILVWMVPLLMLRFFAGMLTYQVENIQTGEIVVSTPQQHLLPSEALLSRVLDINYTGKNLMLFADDYMGNPAKRVSYFPVFAPYALLIEAIVAFVFAFRVDRAIRKSMWNEQGPGQPGPVAIFISYRRSDTAYVVDRLSQTLASEFGRECVFRDLDSIEIGELFDHRIKDAVVNASVVLAVIGKDWLREQNIQTEGAREDWVVLELSLAIMKHIPVIPVLVNSASLPDEGQLPSQVRVIRTMNALHLNPEPYYSLDLNRLLSAIHRILDEAKQRFPSAATGST